MSIKNAKPVARFRPHAESKYPVRAKNVFKGIDTDTGKPVHFYEKDGSRIKIHPGDFAKWKRIDSFGH